MRLKRLIVAMLFTPLLFSCHPRMLGNVLMAAAIVGTVAVLAHHDAHFHDHHCGCHRRYADDRWVYYYGDHWEYYDYDTDTWYYYRD